MMLNESPLIPCRRTGEQECKLRSLDRETSICRKAPLSSTSLPCLEEEVKRHLELMVPCGLDAEELLGGRD